ncbi:hypothetical protein [Candidatus Uabimicrobium sp. HlEnr_7]|uniref:hypothetical protein n=1 Tax=Candidatus Uabimicrobium helgolandensis TaxID=3095367 RepID=UPI0035573C00
MSTYSIKVNCSCGKILKVPEKYAGKRVKCPCERKILIPTIQEIKKKIGDDKEDLRNCPTCGAFLNKDDVICVACRMNLQTGEWDNSAPPATYTKPKSSKFEYIATAAIVIVIVMAGIWVMSDKTPPPSNQDNTVMNPDKDNMDLAAAWSNLNNMPEDNSQAINKKMEAFAKKILGADVTKTMEDLENKKFELMAKEAHESLEKDMDPVSRWYSLEQLTNQFRGTVYTAKNIKSDQHEQMEKIKTTVNAEQQKLQGYMEAKQYQRVLMESFQFSNQIPFSLKSNAEIKPMLSQIDNLYQEALSNLHTKQEENIQEVSPEDNSQQEELQQLETRIASIIQKVQVMNTNWEYKKALDLVEPLAIEAEKYRETESQNVAVILGVHEVLIRLSKLWGAAEQGAEFSVGKKKQLFLRANDKAYVNGTVLKYKDGKIQILTREKKTKVLSLKDIRADEIVNKFALESDFPKEYIYSLAMFFYASNNMPFDVRDTFQKIKKPDESHNNLLARAQAEIDRRKAVQDQIAQRTEEANTEKNLKREEEALKKDKQRAWRHAQSIVEEYNGGHFEKVLDYLQIIKDILPKDEVVKMSKKLGSEEGFTLQKFANLALNSCATCEEGHIECYTCFGVGSIIRKIQLKENTVEKKRRCPTCNGRKKLRCPRCYTRRFSKPFQMLEAWYDDLH